MKRIIVLILVFFLGGVMGTGLSEAAVSTKIIINKSNNKLAFYQDGQLVKVFPVATGRHPSFTPEGSFKIVNKMVNPYYVRGRIPGGSPYNPLGLRWMGLSAGGGSYGIHGNSNPSSIGTYASGGCIRMYNEDVIWLYDRVPIGTPVDIVNKILDFVEQEHQPKILVKLNGNEINFPPEAEPLIRSEQLFLPVSYLAEQFGYQLQWDGPSKTLVLANGEKQFFLTIGSKSYMINMFRHEAQPAPVIHNSYTYLPLYFYEQALGVKVDWDKEEHRVLLETINPVQIGEPVLFRIGIKVETEKLALTEEATPLLFGRHVLVPVSYLSESLGLEVTWDETREAMMIKDKNKLLVMPKGSNTGMLNGENFDIHPQIVLRHGICFVSVDDLARAFNLNVSYNYSSGLLLINK